MSFKLLSDKEAEDLSLEFGVSYMLCRFVNFSINVLIVSEIERQSLFEEKRPLNGADLLQTMRFCGASLYGMMSPLVFKSWGCKNDAVVRAITVGILKLNSISVKKEELVAIRYYRGKRVLQAIENIQEIDAYDEFLKSVGISFST
jgi:hypothetical protein